MMEMRNLEYDYQISLKEEEKLARKESQQKRGKNPNRGSRTVREKFQKSIGGLEGIIVRKREEKVIEEDTMEEEIIFPEKKEDSEEK
jgi:hypothetical protein